MTEHVYRFAQAREWNDDPWWREEATEDADAYCAAVLAAREARPAGAARRRDGLAARPPRRDRGVPGGAPLRRRAGLRALDRRAVRRRPRRRRLGRPRRPRRSGPRTWASSSRPPGRASSTCSPTRTCPRSSAPACRRRSRRELDAAVEAIAASGVAIECSSAGLRKPVGELYPAPALLARFRAAGVPATLSSDAHAPEDVARDYPTAVAALRGAGYETITRFSGREPSQVADPMGMRIGYGARRAPLRPGAAADARHGRGRPRRGPGRPLRRRRRGPRPLRRAAVGGRASPTSGRSSRRATPEWEGASGARLLAVVWSASAAPGLRVVNAHAVVVCERPRLAPHREAMEAALTALRRRAGRGPRHHHRRHGRSPGRGEGVACHAVALLETA